MWRELRVELIYSASIYYLISMAFSKVTAREIFHHRNKNPASTQGTAVGEHELNSPFRP